MNTPHGEGEGEGGYRCGPREGESLHKTVHCWRYTGPDGTLESHQTCSDLVACAAKCDCWSHCHPHTALTSEGMGPPHWWCRNWHHHLPQSPAYPQRRCFQRVDSHHEARDGQTQGYEEHPHHGVAVTYHHPHELCHYPPWQGCSSKTGLPLCARNQSQTSSGDSRNKSFLVLGRWEGHTT